MKKCEECVHQVVCKRLTVRDSEKFEVCENFKDKRQFVQIVRCNECARYMRYVPARGEVPAAGFCIGSFEPVKFVLETDFCPRGKRKIPME